MRVFWPLLLLTAHALRVKVKNSLEAPGDVPEEEPLVTASHGVVMNVYQGDANLDQGENEEEYEPEDMETSPEAVDTLSNTLSRMNMENEEGAKESLTAEESLGRRADLSAQATTGAIADELKSEATELRSEREGVENDIKTEQTKADAEFDKLDAEGRAEREKEFAAEQKLKKSAHEEEAKIKSEEQLLKSDEERLRDDRTLAKEQLAAVQEDEAERLKLIESLAKLRSKSVEDLTVEDCQAMINNPIKEEDPCEEEQTIKQEAKEEECEDPCEEEKKEKEAVEKPEGCEEAPIVKPAEENFRETTSRTLRNGIPMCEEPASQNTMPEAQKKKVKTSSQVAVEVATPVPAKKLEKVGTGCEQCEPLDDCLEESADLLNKPFPLQKTPCESLETAELIELEKRKLKKKEKKPKKRSFLAKPRTSFRDLKQAESRFRLK